MLRCFCAVAKAGNLAHAADRLGRTPSAISMTLKQLEAHLGGPLFESERKNRLTALGEQVFQLGENQLKHFDGTVEAIERLASAPQGVLRIAAVPSVAALAFPLIIRYTSRHFPGLKVELRDADTVQVVEALAQGWADIGLASAQQSLNGVASSLLFSDAFGLVLSDGHELGRGAAPVPAEDVFAMPFLRNALCDQIQSPAIQEHLSQVDVSVYNIQSLLAMIREGDWATLLPRTVLSRGSGGLVFRAVEGLSETRQVYLYARETPSAPEAVAGVEGVIRSMNWSD